MEESSSSTLVRQISNRLATSETMLHLSPNAFRRQLNNDAPAKKLSDGEKRKQRDPFRDREKTNESQEAANRLD